VNLLGRPIKDTMGRVTHTRECFADRDIAADVFKRQLTEKMKGELG
jgi:hypothetical protein